MKQIQVEHKKFNDLDDGDIFRFASSDHKGYGVKVEKNVVILSGPRAFTYTDGITLMGGRPVLKIMTALFFQPCLKDDSIRCPSAVDYGDAIAIEGGFLIQINNNNQPMFMDTKTFTLSDPTYQPSPDDSVVIKEWSYCADLKFNTTALFGHKI